MHPNATSTRSAITSRLHRVHSSISELLGSPPDQVDPVAEESKPTRVVLTRTRAFFSPFLLDIAGASILLLFRLDRQPPPRAYARRQSHGDTASKLCRPAILLPPAVHSRLCHCVYASKPLPDTHAALTHDHRPIRASVLTSRVVLHDNTQAAAVRRTPSSCMTFRDVSRVRAAALPSPRLFAAYECSHPCRPCLCALGPSAPCRRLCHHTERISPSFSTTVPPARPPRMSLPDQYEGANGSGTPLHHPLSRCDRPPHSACCFDTVRTLRHKSYAIPVPLVLAATLCCLLQPARAAARAAPPADLSTHDSASLVLTPVL